MQPKRINLDTAAVYTFAFTGGEIAAIVQALGELPHKIAAPLEAKILVQIEVAAAEPPAPKPPE